MADIEKSVMLETALLNALAIKENYDNYNGFIERKNLLKETLTILDCYELYFNMYGDHQKIDWQLFLTQFCSNWHAQDMLQEDIKFFKEAISKLEIGNCQDSESAILGLINKQLADNIKKIMEKSFTSDVLREELQRYDLKRAAVSKDYDPDYIDLETIDLSTANPENGIPWGFKSLQDKLLGQVPGDLVIVNAAHGLGKSAFVFSQIVSTFRWIHKQGIDQPILFLNSEGSVAQAFGRFLSCLYRENIEGGYQEIVRNQERVKKHFVTKYNKNLLHIERSNGKGFAFIQAKIKKYNPCLVVLDMFKGAFTVGKNQSDVAGLEDFAQRLRDLSAVSCPVWATVQAGDSAKYWDAEAQQKKHKKWPGSEDIYGSKTGIQGAASTIISLGMDDDRPLTRYVRTTKVKAEENAKFICELQKKYSFYKEIE